MIVKKKGDNSKLTNTVSNFFKLPHVIEYLLYKYLGGSQEYRQLYPLDPTIEGVKNMITESQQKGIDEIMDNFDFEKIQKVMTLLNWTWLDSEDVPTLPELRSTARELLRSIFIENNTGAGTGGFEASYESGSLLLEFNIEAYESNVL